MTDPFILAAAREALALDAMVDDPEDGDPTIFLQRIGNLKDHASEHYAAIAAALLESHAEVQRLRGEAEGLKAEVANEQEAHSLIATMCFGAGAESSDGTSTSAVRSLLGIVAALRARLTPQTAEPEE